MEKKEKKITAGNKERTIERKKERKSEGEGGIEKAEKKFARCYVSLTGHRDPP